MNGTAAKWDTMSLKGKELNNFIRDNMSVLDVFIWAGGRWDICLVPSGAKRWAATSVCC
jgi:hypothetical protein